MPGWEGEISRRRFLTAAGAVGMAAAGRVSRRSLHAAETPVAGIGNQSRAEKRNWRKSLELAMEFIGRAYITEVSHPDYHGLWHMYDSRIGKWNRAYMELAWQAVYNALLPYYDYSGEERWLRQAIDMIVDWGLPVVMCRDPQSPACGGMRLNNSPQTAEGIYAHTYHTFDAGDGLLAFLMVHDRTRDARVAEGLELVSAFLRRATTDDGQLRMCFDAAQNRWSDELTIYGPSRGAWPYAYWYSLTGREEYKKWAVAYCRWMLQYQRPNGFLSPHEQEVTEFIIYAVEGLYWTGTYCHVPQFIEQAKFTFDALVRTDKVWPGNTYFRYHADWRPLEAHVHAGEADIERDMLSTCGQYARLAHHFWQSTGEDLYRREFLATVEAMCDFQDRTSNDPHLLGGWPRATNHPWRRSVCPAYNYVGAILLGSDILRLPPPAQK